jgi:hypothetical protein
MVAMTEGAAIDDVNELIIDPALVSDEAKGALWLYAWSLQLQHVQRWEAKQYLAFLTGRERRA